MNVTCDIVRDLLPLYHDGVCSRDSAAAVAEHLETCEACRRELAGMDEPISAPAPDEAGALKAIGKAWDTAKKRSFRRGLLIAGSAALSIALLLGVFFCFFSVVPMIGHSMEPTLSHGDRCVMRRSAIPGRGDIAAVSLTPLGIEDFLDIVRVVGVPGDTIEITDGTLYVNGEAISLYPAGVLEPGDREYPLTLREDEFFVLGDNLANSLDSRFLRYGLVSGNDILGVYVG